MGNQMIDAAAMGSPKVAAVATLTSVTPANPVLFTTYELPPEAEVAAAQMRAQANSCKHQIWQVGPRGCLTASRVGKSPARAHMPCTPRVHQHCLTQFPSPPGPACPSCHTAYCQ